MKRIFTLLMALMLSYSLSYATAITGSNRNVSMDGTVQVGGANGSNGTQWEDNERFNTSNVGFNFYMTWDDNNLYLAWSGSSAHADRQHIVWIDTNPQDGDLSSGSYQPGGTGSTSTFPYGNFNPTLPFTGNVFLNIQSNYNEYRLSSGTWSGGISNTLSVFSNGGNDLEVRIPWSLIGGKPAAFGIISYINEAGGCEESGQGRGFQYAFAPTGARSDGGPCIGTIGSPNNTFIAPPTVNPVSASNGIAPNNPTLIVQGTNSPFPVTYISFNANVENTVVNLNWATSDETNNDFFDVQRSVNAKNFETIGTVKGQLTTAQQTDYSFADLQPNEGINYYRLRQVDVDGSVNFSRIITANVKNSESQSFVLMPNPTTDKLLITNLRSGSNVEIFDLSGQKQKQFTSSGLNLLLETKDISSGMKLIRVTNPDGFSSTKKLMIQR